MRYTENIFDFITAEENSYQTLPISVADDYEWNMYEHIRLTTLYKNSVFSTGKENNKPFKNIIRPILNLAHRAQGFDVKDVQLFIDDSEKYFKSFLVKKYHEIWAREKKIDSFIDDMVEAADYGGTLVKNIGQERPEVVPWARIAFCDQTDILAGPICEKHFYSPSELKKMESKGWGNKDNGATVTIDELITLSEKKKDVSFNGGKPNQTPGKHMKLYELHGQLPNWWMNEDQYTAPASQDSEENYYSGQFHIVGFYENKDGKRNGVTLFRIKEKEPIFKLCILDPIYGRGLGRGRAEELFEAQVWVNYSEIHQKNMLDAASKIILQTTDKSFSNRNKIKNMENLEITVTTDGASIQQVNTSPVNIAVFENKVAQWEQHARQVGAATESIMGESPSAGTPFKLQELITAESHSSHEYRKGKFATFLGEIYQDWIIPYISKEISKDQTFLAELDLDELQKVADELVTCETEKMLKEKILNGELILPEQVDQFKMRVKMEFAKKGNKHFIEILKGELKDAPLVVKTNIKNKQKDLPAVVDKLTNIFRTIIQNPAILQNPHMAKLFNSILEASGLSPIDFSGFSAPMPAQRMDNQLPINGANQPALVGAGQANY